MKGSNIIKIQVISIADNLDILLCYLSNGNVINVLENCFIRYIEKSNGKIYAHIDTMNESGTFDVSNDLYYMVQINFPLHGSYNVYLAMECVD